MEGADTRATAALHCLPRPDPILTDTFTVGGNRYVVMRGPCHGALAKAG